MFLKFKFIFVVLIIQTWLLESESAQSVQEVIQNYAEILSKIQSQIGNLSTDTYKSSSDKVNLVLMNNTLERARTTELHSQMHSEMQQILFESGLTYLPQITKDCRADFERDGEMLARTIAETENICLIFISNVFTLVENPELYKNISDIASVVDGIKHDCGGKFTVREANDCFSNEIFNVKPRVKELKMDIEYFLTEVEHRVVAMCEILHKCYNTARKDVLNKKVRKSVRDFRQCVINKSSR